MIVRAGLCALALLFTLGADAPPTAYRAVVLSMDAARVIVSGGGVLRVAPGCACTPVASGRAARIELDAGGAISRLAPIGTAERDLKPAEAIPAAAFVFARAAATGGDTAAPVEVRITVTVPARTPPTDDIYLSTEKSGWKAADLLMSRIDARRWTIVQTLPRGARFAYRFTRGSFASGERDAASQVPPARILVAQPQLDVTDAVARWADIE